MLTKTHFRNQVKTICGSVILGCLTALATPSMAANDAMLELIEIMRKKGSITEEEYKLLKNAANADAEVASASKDEMKKEVEAATKDLPVITTKEKFEIASKDGDFKWKIGGRIHADAVFFNDDVTDISSGTQFRRARIDVDATLWKNWFVKFQYDFTGGGRAGIRDMFIKWNGWKPTSIIVGNYKQPFSLEELTSSNTNTFIERSLANAPVATLLSRRTGIGASTSFNNLVTLHGSVFSNDVAVATAPTAGIDEGWGIAGRGTIATINSEGRLLHFGLSGAYIGTSQDREGLTLTTRPEVGFFNNTTGALVSTGALGGAGIAANPVDDITMFGIEAAGVYGPAAIQGEYIRTNVGRSGALSDVDFDGYYIEGSYFLTGESRPYDFGSGSFKTPKVKGIVGKGGIGAWQVALRYSNLDLTDGLVVGGDIENLGLALNWYVTNNIRFMANYINVLSVDRPGHVNDNNEPGIFLVRAQANW